MLYERYLRAYAEQFRKTDRNMWNYEDGCVLIGLRALYQAPGDAFYFDVLNSFMERYIEPDGTIRRYVAEEYNLDYIPAGCALYTLYDETGESRYRKAIETLEEQLRHQPRTPCGSFWHKGIYPNQVWLDGLYMGLPFHAAYALRFGDAATLDDIMLQFRNARKYLYDGKTGLYYHAWNETKDVFWADPKTGLSQNFWTRAIGWYLMAMADIYAMLPDSRADLQNLAGILVHCHDRRLAKAAAPALFVAAHVRRAKVDADITNQFHSVVSFSLVFSARQLPRKRRPTRPPAAACGCILPALRQSLQYRR